MTTRLREALDALAAEAPLIRVKPDLYRHARRAYRRRLAAATVLGCLGILSAAVLVVTPGLVAPGPVAAPDAVQAGSAAYRWGSWLGGTPGWGLLAGALLLCGVWWRDRPWRVLVRRLLGVALVGVVLVLSAPPGLALWGEPVGRRGLPSELVPPPTWGARVQDAPIGRAAVLFAGNGHGYVFDQGTLFLVADDGVRHRLIDQGATLLPGLESMLSGDGRYVSYGSEVLEVSTGRPGPQVPGTVKAWSADGRRLAFLRGHTQPTADHDVLGVYDLPSGRVVAAVAVPVTRQDSGTEFEAALSPDGSRVAVTINDVLDLYRVGEDQPYLQKPLTAADLRLAGTAAWTPDGRALAVSHATSCDPCPIDWWKRQWQLQLLDADTGEPVPGPTYRVLPSTAGLRVLGWRSATEPVVRIRHPTDETHPGGPLTSRDDEQFPGPEVATLPPDGSPPRTLMRIPSTVVDLDIAAQYAADPVYDAGPATTGPLHRDFLLPLLALALVVVMVMVTRRWHKLVTAERRDPPRRSALRPGPLGGEAGIREG